MSAGKEKQLFLGVGGMGMAPLAGWLASAGYPVIGYDDDLQEPVRRYLESMGVEVVDIMVPEMLPEIARVVYSSAVDTGHPVLREAHRRGFPVLRRGEMLARLSKAYRMIAVAGSHGKTTTSGMLACALERQGFDVGYILGGFYADETLPARFTESNWLLAEVDESDGTIDGFAPEVTLLLNVDWDHTDRYQSPDQVHDAFAGLLERTRGAVVTPVGTGIGSGASRSVTFGTGGDCALERVGDLARFRFEGDRGVDVGRLPAGAFNQHNALAALACVMVVAGAPVPGLLEGFPGMRRRQSVLSESDDLVVIEDYAHHPTEIAALLEWIAGRYPDHHLVAVYQSHRYSRTREFKRGFVDALEAADSVFLLPVYPAHEAPVDGGRTDDLLAAFGRPVELLAAGIDGVEHLADALRGNSRRTVVAFVGAGDIDRFAAAFCARVNASDRFGSIGLYLQGRISDACRLRFDEPLAPKTTMRVGGPARVYAEPASLFDLNTLLRTARFFGLPVFVMGRGSNLLVPDSGFDGLVIRFQHPRWRAIEALPDGRIWAAAGVRLKEVCGFASRQGLSGFEFMEGIPGSVGGSLRMNAGAMGSWIFDIVERVVYLDAEGRLHDREKSAFAFGYREVKELSEGIALGAVLSGEAGELPESIRERMDSYSTTRKSSQPREPSAGCIFKNPEGNYAGKLIDELGLKGESEGGAQVSTLHGNFIVNRGGASAEDVIRLVRRVRQRVKDETGFELEPEVLLVGQRWQDVLNGGGDSANG